MMHTMSPWLPMLHPCSNRNKVCRPAAALVLLLPVIIPFLLIGCDRPDAERASEPLRVDDQAIQGLLLDGMYVFPPEAALESVEGPQLLLTLGRTGDFLLEVRQRNHRARGLPGPFAGEADLFDGAWRVKDGVLQLYDIGSTTREALRLHHGEPFEPERSGEIVSLRLLPEEIDQPVMSVELGENLFARLERAGGVPLRSLAHLQSFLTRAPLARRMGENAESSLEWTFDEDGTVRVRPTAPGARVDPGSAGHDWWPEGATELRAAWSLDHDPPDEMDLTFSLNKHPTRLTLSNLEHDGTATGPADDTLELDLHWIDGKMRLNIDGQRYTILMPSRPMDR